MLNFVLFLHVLGAVGLGIYAVLPFVVGRFRQLSVHGQQGLASGLYTAGRVGQLALVLQFLSGGYLMSKFHDNLSASWIIAALVLFVALGAATGITQGPLKRLSKASEDGPATSGDVNRVRVMSSIAFIVFLVILWMMVHPW
jgi:hypothetical protein